MSKTLRDSKRTSLKDKILAKELEEEKPGKGKKLGKIATKRGGRK